MLLIRREATQAPYGDHRPEAEVASGIDLQDMLDCLRRQRSIVAGIVLLCLLLATLYILSAVPRFSADALVLIEPQKARLLQGQPVSDTHVESSLVDSQVEVAQSGRVVLRVIRDLNLEEDPELNAPNHSVVSETISFLRNAAASARDYLSTLNGDGEPASPAVAAEPAASEDARGRHLIDNVQENLTVRRLGLTYVLRISYTSENPEKAARIANAIANAYVTDELRGKYDAAKLVAVWMDNRVVELRAEALEADRIAQRFRAEQNMATNESQILLRHLEREAHTSGAVYQAFLTRRKEAVEQESFPITEARIITVAERPLRKSEPRTTLIFGGALCFGLVAGLTIGLLRERLDRAFRTGHQVERETGLGCLALVPRSPRRGLPTRARTQAGDRMLPQDLGLLRYAVEKPDTQFAEAIRGIKVALDIARLDRTIRTLGVVSAMPNEGSSTIACNLAHIVALSGQSVLLVDADLQTSSLTRQMIGSPKKGLCDVILGRERLADVAWHDPKTRLAMLPAGGEASSNASDLLGSSGMRNFANTEGDGSDLIIFDLPPLATFVDVRAVAPAVDAFVLVTAWGQTDQDVVVRALSSSEIVYQRMLGCILNKVDMRAIRSFDRYATGGQRASI